MTTRRRKSGSRTGVLAAIVAAFLSAVIIVAPRPGMAQEFWAVWSPGGPGSTIYTELNQLAARLMDATDGALKLDVAAYPPQVTDQVIADGEFKFGAIPMRNAATRSPFYSAFLEFYRFGDLREVADYSGLMREYGIADFNDEDELTVLGQWHADMISFVTDRAMERPDDFRDMTVFLSSAEDERHAIMRNAGARIISGARPFSERVPALLSGEINAFEIAPGSALGNRPFSDSGTEVFMLPPHRYFGHVLAVGRGALEELDDETRETVLGVIAEFTDERNRRALERYDETMSEVRKEAELSKSFRAVTFDEDQRLDWEQAFSKFADGVLPGRDILTSLESSDMMPTSPAFPDFPDKGMRDVASDGGGRAPASVDEPVFADEPVAATPEPMPEPMPMPMPESAPIIELKNRGIFWNTWQSYGTDQVAAVTRGRPNTHQVHLDLSPYLYDRLFGMDRGIGSSPAGSGIKDLLAKYPDETSIPVRVRAIAIDNALRIRGSAEQPLTIKLEPLRTKPDRDLTNDRDAFQAAFAGAITLIDFSDAIGASRVSFSIDAPQNVNRPCGRIAFSILDDQMMMPLDYVVLSIPIVSAPDTAVPDCRSSAPDQALLQSGADAILASVIEHRGDEERAADIAIQLFETTDADDMPTTVVAIVDGTVDPPNLAMWRTGGNLSTYVENGLEQDIGDSRDAAKAGGQAPYAFVAQRLWDYLFTGFDSGSCDSDTGCPSDTEAKATAARLKQLTDGTHRTITVRVTDASKRPMYVPLGLLAADTEGTGIEAMFKTPATIVQPLSGARYFASDQACIGNWNLAVPQILTGVSGDVVDALLDLPATAGNAGVWLSDLAKFTQYFGEPGSDKASPRTEGLVVLAHHGYGGFWYESGQRIRRIDGNKRKRKFPPGSAAFLAACSTADASQRNWTVVEELNRKNVDAIIASPFPVGADFGAQLAIEFTKLVDSARKIGDTPTIKWLFEYAAINAAAALTSNPNRQRAMQQTALEYILLGDPALRVCED
ncbi:MAG: hypothetical protein RIC16_05320 [Rhodospirillales bacterium]